MSETLSDEASRDVPLVCDIDRSLLIDDALEPALMRMLRRQRRNLLLLLLRLPRIGWAEFKREVFIRADLRADELLFDPQVRDRVTKAQASGRAVWLATASGQELAETVAGALEIPPERAIGTTTINLKGARKAATLVARFGRGGFDYIGDSRSDLAVWRESRDAIVVVRSGTARRRFAGLANLREQIDRTGAGAGAGAAAWLKLIRPHQWPKNFLVFLPLFTGHQWRNHPAWLQGLWAFGVLSLAASAVYVANDALDWSTDRRHPRKSRRPIAAGKVRPLVALAGAAVLGSLALVVAGVHSAGLFACVAAYLLLASSYSFYLKQRVLVDTIVLSHFYIVRIVTGGVAMDIELSPWLLSFAGFAFFSTAMVKRYCELVQSAASGRTLNELRGYYPSDPPVIAMLGIGSGLLACLVLALYLSSDTVRALYGDPEALWATCPVFFYWIGRVWLLAHRGVDVEDPVEFALRDPVSYVILALLIGIVLIAL